MYRAEIGVAYISTVDITNRTGTRCPVDLFLVELVCERSRKGRERSHEKVSSFDRVDQRREREIEAKCSAVLNTGK